MMAELEKAQFAPRFVPATGASRPLRYFVYALLSRDKSLPLAAAELSEVSRPAEKLSTERQERGEADQDVAWFARLQLGEERRTDD